MRRFFFNAEQCRGEIVTLDSHESRHIGRVLRFKTGETVELYDGSGAVYTAQVIEISDNVRLRIIAEQTDAGGESGRLLMGQGIIKVKKMELVLQKCTELGVSGFFPFLSSRCQGNISRQYQGKGERLRRIIDEACKQSLRPQPMDLHDIQPFEDLIALQKGMDNVVKLLFWEHESKTGMASLHERLEHKCSVFLLLGPEGGFTEKEIESAVSAGWLTVGLGKRILRAETAAIAAVSIVQHHLGNM
jgi:16S rRNA (uracil1498-N3)-methyltransferase